jgi:hypothetical protein
MASTAASWTVSHPVLYDCTLIGTIVLSHPVLYISTLIGTIIVLSRPVTYDRTDSATQQLCCFLEYDLTLHWEEYDYVKQGTSQVLR